jgi:hypothetical protein
LIIRFIPDDWIDVVMRPFDMVAPEANTYVEIAAPDIRLAVAVLLLGAVLLLWRRRSGTAAPATLWLATLLLVSTGVWLYTTGNGRYFVAWLVLLGPLCAGLIRLLPMKRNAKLLLAGLIVAAQGFVLTQDPPWDSWTYTEWTRPPYFQIDPPPADPATYVTIASISYSLLIPQFPPESSWISLAGGIDPLQAHFVDQLLASSRPVRLLAPAVPGETEAHGAPKPAAAKALQVLLRAHRLFLDEPEKCQLLHSAGLVALGARQGMKVTPEVQRDFGFWICPVVYRPGAAPPSSGADATTMAVFEAIERMCPRFFPNGGGPERIEGGWVKRYESDTRVYLADDGTAAYKFWRSINQVIIGSSKQILAGEATIDCTKIRAPNWRRGGP